MQDGPPEDCRAKWVGRNTGISQDFRASDGYAQDSIGYPGPLSWLYGAGISRLADHAICMSRRLRGHGLGKRRVTNRVISGQYL